MIVNCQMRLFVEIIYDRLASLILSYAMIGLCIINQTAPV